MAIWDTRPVRFGTVLLSYAARAHSLKRRTVLRRTVTPSSHRLPFSWVQFAVPVERKHTSTQDSFGMMGLEIRVKE